MPVGDIRRDRLSAGADDGEERHNENPAGADRHRGCPARVSTIAQLAAIPEEEIWLPKQKSAAHPPRLPARRAALHAHARDHDAGGIAPGRPQGGDRLGALHARDRARGVVDDPPPARGVVVSLQAPGPPRPRRRATRSARSSGRRSIATKARPPPSRRRRRANCSTCRPRIRSPGLRDRAILSVGLQVGLRRAEIAALTVGDLHQNRGYDSLRVMRKGGRRDALAINPQTAARLRAYLEKAGHGADIDGPLFRPLKHNGKRRDERRGMDPDAIDRVVRKYAAALGLDRGYSAHSMRATFITTALENGAQLEDVQKAAGHRDPSTTKLYDRRGYNPEKAASFFATY